MGSSLFQHICFDQLIANDIIINSFHTTIQQRTINQEFKSSVRNKQQSATIEVVPYPRRRSVAQVFFYYQLVLISITMILKNYLFLIALSSFIASSFADDRSVTSLPASSLQDSKNDHTTIEYLQKRSDTTTPAYQDSEGIFEFHGPNGVNVLKDCTWFQSNTKWRCNNFDTAKEVCIKTCNIPDSPSNVPTAQPSSLTPQIVSAPTDPLFIPWCSDSVAKFSMCIRSIA